LAISRVIRQVGADVGSHLQPLHFGGKECLCFLYPVHTDEYNISDRLAQWGYQHKTVCHSQGEYARDEDGDEFHEVHVNKMEGFWSLLRFWMRPHRGISQEKLPLYLGFFEFVHNARRRGKALLGSLMELFLQTTMVPQNLVWTYLTLNDVTLRVRLDNLESTSPALFTMSCCAATPPKSMTDNVLDEFDAAMASVTWPPSDKANRYSMPVS
jgi:hypothetical protein